MENLVEYLNRRSKKPIDYSPVQVHYSNGKPDGIEIQEDKMHFIISLKDSGVADWNTAMNDAESNNQRLPSKDEWELISKLFDKINATINALDVEYETLEFLDYWTSNEGKYDDAFVCYPQKGRFYDRTKNSAFSVRTIRDV